MTKATRPFTLVALAFLGAAVLGAPAANAKGDGREAGSPWSIDDPEKPDHEREGDPKFRAMLERGAEGELERIWVKFVDGDEEKSVALDMLEAGGTLEQTSGKGKSGNPLKAFSSLFSGKVTPKIAPDIGPRYGSAYVYEREVFVFPDASTIAPGDPFADLTRKFFVIEQYADEDPWNMTFGATAPQPTDDALAALYRAALQNGSKFGDAYYQDNRLTIVGDKNIVSGY